MEDAENERMHLMISIEVAKPLVRAARDHGGAMPSHYPGARRFALDTGELVRLIDARTYEVIETGELLLLVG